MTTPRLSREILERFETAIADAERAGEPEHTAMVVATTDGAGLVSTRTVLLKGVGEDGFVFYTNTLSRKGRQLSTCPRAAATFLWKSIYCQVQLVGAVEPVTDAEADAYFASRDRGSQVGAWASLQSEPLDSRATLESRVAEFEKRYAGQTVPRPPHWSGYRLRPETVEFWHGREHRLHDRTLYRWRDEGWESLNLYP